MRIRLAAQALSAAILLSATAGCVHGSAVTPPDPATVSADRKGVICASPDQDGPDQDGLCQTLRDWAQVQGLAGGQAIPVYRLRTDGALWNSLSGDARKALRGYQWIVVETAPAPAATTRLASAVLPAAQAVHPDAAAAASSTSEPMNCQRCDAAGAEGVN